MKCATSVTSANLVHRSSNAEIRIQEAAPGLPMATVPAAPAILPVPTVAASVVQTVWKGVALCRILVFQDVTPLTQLNKAGSATLIQANADNA